jgi:hypothetical protein
MTNPKQPAKATKTPAKASPAKATTAKASKPAVPETPATFPTNDPANAPEDTPVVVVVPDVAPTPPDNDPAGSVPPPAFASDREPVKGDGSTTGDFPTPPDHDPAANVVVVDEHLTVYDEAEHGQESH